MQKLHWEIPARLQGTAKLKTSSPPSKENSVKKRGDTKKKRIVPDDIHVNINFVFVQKKKKKNCYSRIERRKR